MATSQRRFIFLDIDGVLNTSAQWKRPYRLDDGCVSRFVRYVRSQSSESVRIILTSSWKHGFDFAGHHSPQIGELLRKFSSAGLKVLGKTGDRTDGDRAGEINDFIKSHRLEEESCIVIDDDASLFRTALLPNCRLILTDASKGFDAPVDG